VRSPDVAPPLRATRLEENRLCTLVILGARTDRALGFDAALRRGWPEPHEQRDWRLASHGKFR
jgi:hypothetical protein